VYRITDLFSYTQNYSKGKDRSMETKCVIRVLTTGNNLVICTKVVAVQESRVICLEDPAEGQRHSTHEQPRHFRRDSESGCSIEKDRLVGECDARCQSRRVGPIDIRSNIRAGWHRVEAFHMNGPDECVKVAWAV
jgi:hypothetical protein